MNDDGEIRAWRRSLAAAPVPAGFADGVMRAVLAEAEGTRLPRRLGALLRSPHARAAACLVAAALFLGRLACVASLFIAR